MRFESNRSIYEQIVDYIKNQILVGHWSPGDRLPSVRELAVELGVNPNTVQRSYTLLQSEMVVFNQRGVGYFVADDGPHRAREGRRRRFEAETLPRVFETMHVIGYSMSELESAWEKWEKGARR